VTRCCQKAYTCTGDSAAERQKAAARESTVEREHSGLISFSFKNKYLKIKLGLTT